MKITSDKDHSDYHDVVNFVQAVTLDGVVLSHCVHADTELGEAQCWSQPMKPVDGYLPTHVVKGKVEIVWREPAESENGLIGGGSRKLFEHLKADWEERELLRKQEVYSI